MGGVPNAPGPSPTLGSLGPSHQWHHKSRASLRGPPCAHGVAGTPQGEVRDTRRPGSVQTNLFGGTPDDPAAGFRHHMRQLADELRAETGEERRISGDEDDPVTENPMEETAAEPETGNEEEEEDEAADEDEEEEEDPGLGNSGDDDDDDDDSPPASSHRPVTRSSPKKQPVSRPKRKAYRNKSGPRSSSRKRTRNRR